MERREPPSDAPEPTEAGHLDLLQLDAVRAGEGTPAERAHVATCPGCRRTVEGLRDVAAAMGRELAPRITIPAHVDGLVFAHARGARLRVGRRRWMRRHWRSVAAMAAAAAAVFVALALWQPWSMPPAEEGPSPQTARAPAESAPLAGDIDGSRRVDILDAFLLARRIEQAEALDLAWDMNGDGLVDVHDVDAVADLAVALNGSEG